MTETEQLADIIALSVHAATEPLLTKLAVLEARPVTVATKEAWDGLQAVVSDLRLRLASVEARPPDVGPQGLPGQPGRDGKDADLSVVTDLRTELATVRSELLAIKAWPAPKDGINGTSVTLNDVAPLIAAEVTKAVTSLPKPKDGASVSLEDVRPLIVAEVAKIPPPRPGADGKDGASVTVADVAPVIASEVQKAVAALPPPKQGDNGKDGQSVTLEDVEPLIVVSVAKAFDAMLKPKDGLGIKSAVVNNDGRLLLTMSDDEVKDLGVVVGRPGRDGLPAIGRAGQDGRDGTSVTLDDVRPMILGELAKSVAKIPIPKDGRDGKDGLDGLGVDDFDLTFDATKGWALMIKSGTRTKAVPLPVPFDAGVWKAGPLYPKAASVTKQGSIWIAQEATRTCPGDGSPESARAWRLAVKGGRDGKAGKDGRDGKDWDDR